MKSQSSQGKPCELCGEPLRALRLSLPYFNSIAFNDPGNSLPAAHTGSNHAVLLILSSQLIDQLSS